MYYIYYRLLSVKLSTITLTIAIGKKSHCLKHPIPKGLFPFMHKAPYILVAHFEGILPWILLRVEFVAIFEPYIFKSEYGRDLSVKLNLFNYQLILEIFETVFCIKLHINLH